MAAFKFRGIAKQDLIVKEGVTDENGLGEFFKRVDNLVWIKENSYYREALEDCKERKKSLGEKLDRREKRVEELTNQIYNVVGFFSVFQGVILTAVTQLTQSTQPPRPLCGKVWFPVVLSGLAAIAAAFGIGLKYRHLNSIDKLIHNERLEQREAERREAELQGKGKRFKFKEVRDARRRKQASYWLLKAAVVIGGVIAFTLVFILSYFVILCDKLVIKGW
ncbi:hypothetical protein KC19_4G235400 [Ceratodon purpureus]|uniref:Transmembrane protein n=1 Tax=Ceratodon purpureus TaxID=3225 RepID=A0A8T0IE85_CERPU|nr:hypothetical protein KC19_4G235000 [Ceratodon purpureus]KAG0581239.1 hypothetical protein KC19_4G235400 [Ceratodon purpureus]